MAAKETRQALATVQAYRHSSEMQAVLTWLALLEKDALESLVKCSKEQHDFHASEVITLRYLTHAITQPSFEETQAKYKGAQ